MTAKMILETCASHQLSRLLGYCSLNFQQECKQYSAYAGMSCVFWRIFLFIILVNIRSASLKFPRELFDGMQLFPDTIKRNTDRYCA